MVEVWTVAPAACAPELVARGTLHVAVAVGFALTKRFVAATDEGEFAGNEADEIASGFFDVLERRIKLWKKYHGRIKKQLSPERAGQFVQI